MPLYDFECIKCYAKVDRICSYEEKENQICPLCASQLVPMLTVLSDYGINVEGRPKKWS